MTDDRKSQNYEYFASCPKGFEECLDLELKKLGHKQNIIHTGGVAFKGKIDEFLAPLLSSRIASRIFIQIATAKFKDVRALEQFLGKIEWEKYIHFKQTFRFRVVWDSSLNLEMKNSLYWAQKSKDALVDRLRDKFNQRPNVDTKTPDTDFLVRMDKNRNVTVLVDLSGEPLHKRGYRDSGHKAPLKENLAAGLVALSDWNTSTPLLDPMCGSGTILTEALLFKFNISPQILNLLDNKPDIFAFQKFYYLRPFNEVGETYQKLRLELIKSYESSKALYSKETLPQFFANDTKHLYVQSCREQFALFGASNLLDDCSQDALDLKKSDFIADEKELTIITNPPYGERLGELEELESFYYEFGEILKNKFKTTSVYILCGSPELRKKISLKTKSKKIVFNGPIECRLLRYELY